MPSRVLREGLLDSRRWHAVSAEARCLFIALLLLADDFGLLHLTPYFLGRHAFQRRPSDARIEKLVAELVAVDLVRAYYAGTEEIPERYGFLPRFRQNLRQMRGKHPLPPSELYADDPDAEAKFIKHKDLFKKLQAGRLQVAISSTAEVKRSDLDLDSETKRNDLDLEGKAPVDNIAATVASPRPEPPFYKHSTSTPTSTPPSGKSPNGDLLQWAKEAGIEQLSGESELDFKRRVSAKFGAAKH